MRDSNERDATQLGIAVSSEIGSTQAVFSEYMIARDATIAAANAPEDPEPEPDTNTNTDGDSNDDAAQALTYTAALAATVYALTF